MLSRARAPASRPVSVQDWSLLFRGLADPTRIRIVNLLSAGELCVCDVVSLLGLPQPVVSRHLAYLRRAGLVEARRAGRFAHYRLASSTGPVHRRLLSLLRRDFPASPSLAGERADARARCTVRRAAPCPEG